MGCEVTPFIGRVCCFDNRTGCGHDQLANVRKNASSNIDGLAVGFSLHTQQTRMAQLFVFVVVVQRGKKQVEGCDVSVSQIHTN